MMDEPSHFHRPIHGVWFAVKLPNDLLPALPNDILPDIMYWCDEEIGNENYDFSVGWSDGSRDFYFKTEEDQVKFILRWL